MELASIEDLQWVRDVAKAAIKATNANVKSALYSSLTENLSDFFDMYTGNVEYSSAGVEVIGDILTFRFIADEEDDDEEPDFSWDLDLKTGKITRNGVQH